jgi:excisionase family DNA binding protein
LLLSLSQAAHELAVSKRTVERMVTSGHLPSIRVIRQRRIPYTILIAFIENQLSAYSYQPAQVDVKETVCPNVQPTGTVSTVSPTRRTGGVVSLMPRGSALGARLAKRTKSRPS